MGIIDYSKVINKTVENIKPSGIRRFFDIASSMENVISLVLESLILIHLGRLEKPVLTHLKAVRQNIPLTRVMLYLFRKFLNIWNANMPLNITLKMKFL